MIPELVNGTSHGFSKRVNKFCAFAQTLVFAMGCCFPKNDPLAMPGIAQSSAGPPFLSKTFHAITKQGNAKAKKGALPPQKTSRPVWRTRSLVSGPLNRGHSSGLAANAYAPAPKAFGATGKLLTSLKTCEKFRLALLKMKKLS